MAKGGLSDSYPSSDKTIDHSLVEAQKIKFKKIVSIELGRDLFENARKRFQPDKHILIVQGDSGKILPQILNDIHKPAIFWLDGHYSEGITAKGDKECPIFEELDAIFKSQPFHHVPLIDDARCFTGERDYPMIERLTEFIRSNSEKYHVDIKHDMIRCVIGPAFLDKYSSGRKWLPRKNRS